eukprot:scaffold207598_cov27-Tisochrysis_lutea.AAC.5
MPAPSSSCAGIAISNAAAVGASSAMSIASMTGSPPSQGGTSPSDEKTIGVKESWCCASVSAAGRSASDKRQSYDADGRAAQLRLRNGSAISIPCSFVAVVASAWADARCSYVEVTL